MFYSDDALTSVLDGQPLPVNPLLPTVVAMRRLSVGLRTFVVGDEVAQLMLEYAALVAQTGRGDCVRFSAVDLTGNDLEAAVLLNSGTQMVAETIESSLPEPVNTAAERYLTDGLSLYSAIPTADMLNSLFDSAD